MLLLHPPVAPWAVAGADGIDLVLLTDAPLAAGRVFIRTLPDNEELLTPMHPDGHDGAWRRWRAHIAWDGGNALTLYAFAVAADDGHVWLAADGPHPHVPPEALHFRVHPTERPPAWVAEQVFYQVFPDRFARGAGGDATPTPLLPWGAAVDPARSFDSFHGGNLPGLRERLPYLHDELGINAIYLNPVFASSSNHRYDTDDYTQVDPLLGGNTELAALRADTRARGMRLVLDAVVNHTGAQHRWLADAPAMYARDAAGRALGWKGHASLPVLDFAHPAVPAAVYGDADAVLRRWLRAPYAIDGWRLDVIHMLGEGRGAHNNAQHVRAMRRAIRAENADAYVLGEHFAEATRWLQSDQEDGAMNYHGFAAPVRAWLAGLELGGRSARIGTTHFERWLARAAALLPHANLLAQLNLLGSHDTPRMLTLLGGDTALMQLALTLLFTRPGVPCLYYGDEIGLQGGADPDNRGCFDWDRSHWQMDLWTHCQRLAQARRARSEWRRGATLTLAQGADWLAYARFDAQAASVVVVNRGAAVDVDVPLRGLPGAPNAGSAWQQLGSGTLLPTDGALHLALQARSSVVVLSD